MTALTNRLRLIAPVIKDHGIDYERGKFQDKLDDGSLTLARTEVMCVDTFCCFYKVLSFTLLEKYFFIFFMFISITAVSYRVICMLDRI